jgi:prevent-host-death family protein
MTGIVKSSKAKATKTRKRTRLVKSGPWRDAKARFSELVRRVFSDGPQHVTAHARDEVVIISADEFRRLKGDLTGEVLIAAMQAFPHRDVEIVPGRTEMPAREVFL